MRRSPIPHCRSLLYHASHPKGCLFVSLPLLTDLLRCTHMHRDVFAPLGNKIMLSYLSSTDLLRCMNMHKGRNCPRTLFKFFLGMSPRRWTRWRTSWTTPSRRGRARSRQNARPACCALPRTWASRSARSVSSRRRTTPASASATATCRLDFEFTIYSSFIRVRCCVPI